MGEHIVTERDAGILRLRMQRPDKMNALTRAMYARMADALQAAARDDGIRAVLIAGSETCFTSGNDVADFLDAPPPAAVMDSKRLMRAPDREALRAVILEEGELFGRRLRSPEAVEALSAFLQRRPADFSRLR